MSTDIVDSLRSAVEQAITELRTGKFWTDRRDAADALTDSAVDTAACLKELYDDPDADVQAACRKSFDRLRSALDIPAVDRAPIQPKFEPSVSTPETDTAAASAEQLTIEQMVSQVAASANWQCRPQENGFEIACRLTSGRQQKVHIRTGQTDNTGKRIVQVFSICAPAAESAFRWALESNCKLHLGALAVLNIDGTDTFVVMDSHLEDGLMPDELDADVCYVAETADWIENQLTSGDRH